MNKKGQEEKLHTIVLRRDVAHFYMLLMIVFYSTYILLTLLGKKCSALELAIDV